MLEKYVADFTALLQDPLFQQQSDPRCRMVITTRILREKKHRIPFSAIASFFSVPTGTIQQHWKRSKKRWFPNDRITKQGFTKVRSDSQKSAQSNRLI
jgi:hypothetical protein